MNTCMCIMLNNSRGNKRRQYGFFLSEFIVYLFFLTFLVALVMSQGVFLATKFLRWYKIISYESELFFAQQSLMQDIAKADIDNNCWQFALNSVSFVCEHEKITWFVKDSLLKRKKTLQEKNSKKCKSLVQPFARNIQALKVHRRSLSGKSSDALITVKLTYGVQDEAMRTISFSVNLQNNVLVL